MKLKSDTSLNNVHFYHLLHTQFNCKIQCNHTDNVLSFLTVILTLNMASYINVLA